MNKTSITEKLVNNYVEQYLENSKKVNYDQIDKCYNVTTAFFDELPEMEIDGFPFASDLVAKDGTVYSMDDINKLSIEEQKKCSLRYHFLPNIHELYVGTTGSGKTTGCVEPQLRAISNVKNKANIFLTDPKGELYERNVKHLIDNGYKIYVLNFKNYERSDRWNPLLFLYDLRMEIEQSGVGVKHRTGKVKSRLLYTANPSEYGEDYYEYHKRAFKNLESCNQYIEAEKEMKKAELSSEINQIVHMMITVQSTTDKSWEFGAQDLLRGIMYCMLEDAVNPKSGFTREMMNFRNIKKYYTYLRGKRLSDNVSFDEIPLLADKSDEIKTYMRTALDNAPNTMRSYCGVFDGATQKWFQSHIFTMTTGNSIDLENINDQPFAIFLITRDYEKSDFTVAGLFVDWVYKKMLEKNEKNGYKRPLHFLLDEFGNIPEIVDLGNKIATSRSRNIWFHLVVQSYKQINAIYGNDNSVVIVDNCNSQMFLGSQNIETKEIFAKQCGEHTILTIQSYLKPNTLSLNVVQLIPKSLLDLIKPGQIYMKRIYMPVVLTQFIRSYVCAELGFYKDFFGGQNTIKYAPYASETFNSNKYNFEPEKENNEKNIYEKAYGKYGW